MIQFAEPLALRAPRVVEVGDLSDAAPRDTVEAAGLFLHPAAPSRWTAPPRSSSAAAASEAVCRMDGN
jgi:hypothetical protein